MTLERVPESGRALQRHSEYQRMPTLAFQVRRVLQLPSLPVCHGTSNNDFYSLQCKAGSGSLLVRSYRALTAVTPSIPCASGHHYATRSKSDTNTEEEEIIWSIFMSNACQSGHGGGNMTPASKGKFAGIVLRALTIDVSVVDLTVKIEKATTWKKSAK